MNTKKNIPHIRVIKQREQMTWEGSQAHCAKMVQKIKDHDHKIPHKSGDTVRDPQGRIGILTRKEFIRENSECGPGHDVWNLLVSYGAITRTFVNPAELVVVSAEDKKLTFKKEAL